MSEGPLSRQPDKLDYASPTQFRFIINQLPKVEYFTTACNVPAIGTANTEMATPFKNIPIMGDVTEFEDGDLFGFVDSHSHLFTNLAFGGGGVFHGAPFHPQSKSREKSAAPRGQG